MQEPRTITILLCEDDQVTRASMATYLRNLGYQTLEAEDGRQALTIFRDRKPDVVITDLRMPGLDGLQLLTTVVAESPGTPVIIVSGQGTMQDAIDAQRIGAWDYLTKPLLDLALLRHAVERVLERVWLREQQRRYEETLEETVARRTAELKQRTEELEQEIHQRRIMENIILQAKNEWELTVDSIPDFIALVDRNDRIIRANRSLAEAVGVSPEELVGEHCCQVLRGRNRPLADCPHRQILNNDDTEPYEVEEELWGRIYRITVAPFIDPAGKRVIGSVLVGRDISRERKMERERDLAQSQLLHAQKLESVGRLAAGIAHEINTPTQFIGSNLDFLQEGFTDVTILVERLRELLAAGRDGRITPELLEEIEHELEEIDWDYLKDEIPAALAQSRDGVGRVTSIVRAMKEFSHPGSREKEPVSINRIIETTTTVARNEWKYVAEVELDLDEDLPPLPCLSDEIGQVILNLLVNAAQAIGEKLGNNPEGEKGRITIVSRRDRDRAEIRISDTGCGIPAEIRDKVFDPFFTTKEVGKGTGQGLAIARDVVVSKHGGSLEVESVVGESTTFIIHLPLSDHGDKTAA